MAGWNNSMGSGTGRGAGGRGFPNRRYSIDTIHGGSSGGGGSSRWRGDRSRGRPPSQPHYRYRPVDTAHRHSPPSAGPQQPSSSTSTSTRHAQMSHPAAANDKSHSSGTVAPACSNKEPDDKGSCNAANFECNVCFDMAKEPVVTKCGHLFCWECLYQWLHVHSQDRECPVCKGQVAVDAIIPIYGRGGSAASVKNAPPRPTGARVESSRQQQQHHRQLHTLPYDMVYVDDDDEDNPFDFPSMVNFGFVGGSSLRVRDAVGSFMTPSFHDMDMDDQYDEYSYEFNPEDFDEVYDHNLMGFPVFASDGTEAGHPSSSQIHADLIDLTDSVIPVHHEEFSHSAAPHLRNRGRHGRRCRARASADQSSTDAMVTGGSGTFYHDNGANSNGSVGASASSRPDIGWVDRRGRSNRNSNSAGARGMHDDR